MSEVPKATHCSAQLVQQSGQQLDSNMQLHSFFFCAMMYSGEWKNIQTRNPIHIIVIWNLRVHLRTFFSFISLLPGAEVAFSGCNDDGIRDTGENKELWFVLSNPLPPSPLPPTLDSHRLESPMPSHRSSPLLFSDISYIHSRRVGGKAGRQVQCSLPAFSGKFLSIVPLLGAFSILTIFLLESNRAFHSTDPLLAPGNTQYTAVNERRWKERKDKNSQSGNWGVDFPPLFLFPTFPSPHSVSLSFSLSLSVFLALSPGGVLVGPLSLSSSLFPFHSFLLFFSHESNC
jgi:hypothetical protein